MFTKIVHIIDAYGALRKLKSSSSSWIISDLDIFEVKTQYVLENLFEDFLPTPNDNVKNEYYLLQRWKNIDTRRYRRDLKAYEAPVKDFASLLFNFVGFQDGNKFSFEPELAPENKIDVGFCDYENNKVSFSATSDLNCSFNNTFFLSCECKDFASASKTNADAQVFAGMLRGSIFNFSRCDNLNKCTIFGAKIIGDVFTFYQAEFNKEYVEWLTKTKSRSNRPKIMLKKCDLDWTWKNNRDEILEMFARIKDFVVKNKHIN